jgi:hypothetical protein
LSLRGKADAQFQAYRKLSRDEAAIWVILVKPLEEGDGPRPAVHPLPARSDHPDPENADRYSSLYPEESGLQDMFTIKGFVTTDRPFGVNPSNGE